MRPRYINEKIELELVEFKKEIEDRFAKSEMNKNFTYPRKNQLELEEHNEEAFDITQQQNFLRSLNMADYRKMHQHLINSHGLASFDLSDTSAKDNVLIGEPQLLQPKAQGRTPLTTNHQLQNLLQKYTESSTTNSSTRYPHK